VLGRTDLVGRVGSLTASATNAVTGKPGSLPRKIMARTVGIASQRLLPPFARQRFSTWFSNRAKVRVLRPQGSVAVFATCLVEYQQPRIGHDLVKVYERNNLDCALVDAGCCGAPWLHAGEVDQFTKQATKNIEVLATVVRSGRDIVVPQPTCSYILKKDYVDYVGGPDAELVAAHTFDACEYLMKVHKAEGTSLDTTFSGDVPDSVTYHTPCHLRAQNIGLKSRDLMKLTGTKITLVQQCSGVDGMWGLREENFALSEPVGAKLADMVTAAGGEIVAGDCHLANGVITEKTGRVPQHPLQVMARAYGLAEEP
jgi:glycerol-3-phosphate dehydrogenase subunit C